MRRIAARSSEREVMRTAVWDRQIGTRVPPIPIVTLDTVFALGRTGLEEPVLDFLEEPMRGCLEVSVLDCLKEPVRGCCPRR